MSRLGRGKRMYRRGERSGRWIVIAAIAAFVLLSFIISAAVGIVLGEKADKYEQKINFQGSFEPYKSGSKTVRAAEAYIYQNGIDASVYISQGIEDLSVCLRDKEGKLHYSIDASEDGLPMLSDTVKHIHDNNAYACAYFYVRELSEDAYAMELETAYDVWLLNQASKAGVDEILLVGLEISEESIDNIEKYVSRISSACDGVPVGVLIKPEIFALAEEDIYFASRIRNACDFAAIDLGMLPADADQAPEGEKSLLERTLEENAYYIKSGSLRAVLYAENSALYNSLKNYGMENIQVIGE